MPPSGMWAWSACTWVLSGLLTSIEVCRAAGGLEAERTARDQVQAAKEAQDKRNHEQLLRQRRESFRKVLDTALNPNQSGMNCPN